MVLILGGGPHLVPNASAAPSMDPSASSSPCRIDAVRHRLGVLRAHLAKPKPDHGHRMRLEIESLARFLGLNPCLQDPRPDHIDPEAAAFLDEFRSVTLDFYSEPSFSPYERRAALFSVLLVPTGSDYWETGVRALVDRPLQLAPGNDWRREHRRAGLTSSVGLDQWRRSFLPAGLLRTLVDQRMDPDFRLDLAALIVASELPSWERGDYFKDYEIDIPNFRALEWNLEAVERTLHRALTERSRQTGRLPEALHDEEGRLLADQVPNLFQTEDGRTAARWLYGWPGIRLADYESHGSIGIVRIVGHGFDFETSWWLTVEDKMSTASQK